MKTVCQINQCAGCMACVEVCPKKTIKIEDNLCSYNAVIGDGCVNCGMCHKVCPNNKLLECIAPQQWYQGWAKQQEVRSTGSSGGLARALAETFVRDGGEVCSCVLKDGQFTFELADSLAELKKFAGSKYVKSNPFGIYKMIRDKLKVGTKILFIGLPCQVAALRNFVGAQLETNLYTVDLICHGTPSPQILELFLQQYGASLDGCTTMRFRTKGKYRLERDDKGFTPERVTDCYLISFLNTLTYTENCYSCQYAKLERVSDITLGDSWGSELDATECEKGISLILCQTSKGEQLMKSASLELYPVDLQKAVANNHQLEHPSIKPDGRERFFTGISKGEKFNRLVFRTFPKQCIKQDIKRVLIGIGVMKSK